MKKARRKIAWTEGGATARIFFRKPDAKVNPKEKGRAGAILLLEKRHMPTAETVRVKRGHLKVSGQAP